MSAPAIAALATVALDPELSRLSKSDVDHLTEYITLTQAAAELPRRRGGKKTHVVTLYRWTTKGCRGAKLRYAMVGCTRCTTRQWLAEFFERITQASGGEVVTPRTSRQITRASERAEAELTAAGI